ncbi:MAG: hypothetical protein R3D44_05810 [Hyphomicrobiaceae bacterium]
MPQYIPVGLAAGLATALLFASASAGGMAGRMILFFLAPLPSYLAGLGWGAVAAGLAAIASAVGTAVLLGVKTGLVFFVSQGVPLAILCRLVLLNRPVGAAAGDFGPDQRPLVEWYPTGRVVAVAALLAGCLSLVSVLMLGVDLEGLRAMMRKLVDNVLARELPGLGAGELTDKDKDTLANVLLHALPAGSAVLWLGGFTLNLWLAGKITLFSGRLARPWPDLTLIRFPAGFGLALAAALGLSLLPGLAGLLASGFAGGLFFAYALVGLAIIHHTTRGLPARPLILWGVYLTVLLFNTTALIVVALIAVLEPLLWYRRPNPPDYGPAGPAPPPTPPPTGGA